MTLQLKTILSSAALGGALLIPALATAQGTGGGGFPGPTRPTPAAQQLQAAPVYNPTPTSYTPEAFPRPNQPTSATRTSDQQDAPVSARPQGSSLGIGMTYTLGVAKLSTPTGGSARFRMASGLTFEPFVRLATHSQSEGSGNSKNAQNELMVGTNVRLPLKSRGKVDIIALGGLSAGTKTDDPDGGSNNTTTTTFDASYGLGVEYWYSANWCLSFTASNPLLSYTSTSLEVSNDLDTNGIDVGVIWNPVTELSLHLFY